VKKSFFLFFALDKRERKLKMKREKLFNSGEVYGLLKTSVKYQTKEFFNNSTLHGVRYIAEKGRAFGEKFMWFCFVSIGVVAAFVIIGSLWEKFQTNPTITGIIKGELNNLLIKK
jgi:acid-sensing ion channel, other